MRPSGLISELVSDVKISHEVRRPHISFACVIFCIIQVLKRPAAASEASTTSTAEADLPEPREGGAATEPAIAEPTTATAEPATEPATAESATAGNECTKTELKNDSDVASTAAAANTAGTEAPPGVASSSAPPALTPEAPPPPPKSMPMPTPLPPPQASVPVIDTDEAEEEPEHPPNFDIDPAEDSFLRTECMHLHMIMRQASASYQ